MMSQTNMRDHRGRGHPRDANYHKDRCPGESDCSKASKTSKLSADGLRRAKNLSNSRENEMHRRDNKVGNTSLGFYNEKLFANLVGRCINTLRFKE